MDIHLLRIQDILAHDNWPDDSILRLMSSFRHIIEIKKIHGKYVYLNLYCNWVLHPEISGSNTGLEILGSLTDDMIAHNLDPINAKWIADAVIEGISLHKLREDIEKFCLEFSINNNVLSELSSWERFVTLLIKNELLNKPIKFPDTFDKKDKNAKKIYDSIQNRIDKTLTKDNMILGITFTVHDEKIRWKIVTETSLGKNLTILGPLAIINQEMIDNYRPPSELN